MKSQNTILRRRRAVSPVIATVVLVAVTITVAVAVSYWMSGIASQYTAFEKVEIQSGYSDIQPGGGWVISLVMKNSGSATANLITVFVNDEPVELYSTLDPTSGLITAATLNTFTKTDSHTATGILEGEATGTNIPDTGLAIESGKTAEVISESTTVGETNVDSVQVYIGSGLFSSGTTINIKIHSAGGMDYIKLIQLT